MVNIEYANAYTEVLEILKFISEEDYSKIPKEKINLFEANANKDYKFNYDINKTLDEQNVSKKAKIIIAILFRDYWASEVQREKIKAKEEYDRQYKTKEINGNYIINTDVTNEYTEIVVYKENLIKRIINIILSWIRK